MYEIFPGELIAAFLQRKRDRMHVHVGDQHRIIVWIGRRRILLEEFLVTLLTSSSLAQAGSPGCLRNCVVTNPLEASRPAGFSTVSTDAVEPPMM